jgi:hypothetical protein
LNENLLNKNRADVLVYPAMQHNMVEVVRYSARYKQDWDAFVRAAKNGTFLLLRDYMEYHADRFEDHSLLFYNKGKLVAVLPANTADDVLHSHAGLSYGGMLSGKSMKAPLMLQVFAALTDYCRSQGFAALYYKAIPYIYHQLPAEEDLYALFRSGAQLYRRDVNSVVDLGQPRTYSKDRRWRLSQARKKGLEVALSGDYDQFMKLEQELLQQKFNLRPVHTTAEMQRLADLFKQEIKLYTVSVGGKMVAGTIMFEAATVAHSQYMGANAEGHAFGATNVLVDHLLSEVYPHKKYFSFGVSTEQQGLYLNEGLVGYKESYGARSVVHDFYRLDF